MTGERPRRRFSDREESGRTVPSGFLDSPGQEDHRTTTADERGDASVERRQRDLEWNGPERRLGRS